MVTEIPAKNNVVNKKFADGTTKVRVLILDEFPNLIGMFCEGSTLKAYEPYTGGQPSPSPDYPQEIKSVVNPIVKVCGKNLWSGKNTQHYWMGDNETVNYDCISSDYIPIKGSQTIYAGFSYDWYAGFNCYDSKKK